MTVLCILAAIALILFLLYQVPAGLRAEYSEDGPEVSACLGPFHVKIYPWNSEEEQDTEESGKKQDRKEKKQKQKKEKKKKSDEQASPAEETGKGPEEQPGGEEAPRRKKKKKPSLKEKAGGVLETAQLLLPPVLDFGRQFMRGVRVDTLEMELTAGAPDPADAAMLYGNAQAVLGALWYPVVDVFDVRDGHAWTKIDFSADRMRLHVLACCSMKLGRLARITLHLTLRIMTALQQQKKKSGGTRRAAESKKGKAV